MSKDQKSKVFMFDNEDPEMQQAYANARSNFKYFWREMSWEYRRIIPGLDMACVKAPFADPVEGEPNPDEPPEVEHMWISDVEFDGKVVRGTLINEPNNLTSVSAGDKVKVSFKKISDWMYAIRDEVFGAYTVNLMRARMSSSERKQHDAAWGLKFGDPHIIRLFPDQVEGNSWFKKLFAKKQDPNADHPMCLNMIDELKKMIKKDPKFIKQLDKRGMTWLHSESLAGNLACVQVLLEAGSDKKAVAKNGLTPIQLAKLMGWDQIVEVLK